MLRPLSLLFLAGFVARGRSAVSSGPWDAFNYSPHSRTVAPLSIHSTHGPIEGAQGLVKGGSATFKSKEAYLTLDFGKEVGGILSLNIDNATNSSAFSFAFTESSIFISPTASDDSGYATINRDADGAEHILAPLTLGPFTQPADRLRGGFRFLTIASTSDDPLTISNITLAITFAPDAPDLRAYTGYFYADDPVFHDRNFLTKIWYAGAYTAQTNIIDSNQARMFWPTGVQGWANNASGGPVEGTILVDGAKRDRNVWPGDMGISANTHLLWSTDLLPIKNSLLVMFSTSDPVTGALNYSGPPINAQGSDTYISWTLIGTHTYWLYSNDTEFVQRVWTNYTKAVAFLENQVDSTGLMDVPIAFMNDWGRDGGSGHNSAANALLYQTLLTGADLAKALGDNELAIRYLANATTVKAAYNTLLWDAKAGMYRDNDTTTLHPEDGNSLAVEFNLTTSESQIQAISQGLTKFWTDIGPVTPELADTIIPFVGGFELRAHFIAGQGERALDLIRKEWGYMLYTNLSVQSTLLEGFTANGSLGYRSAVGYDHDFSYTSHAHGWSTGPTPALSFHVLGLQITTPLGATWSLKPVLSGLSAAEGGFETGLGWFGVKWSVAKGTLTVVVTAPDGTSGVVGLPGHGAIKVDGRSVGSGTVTVTGGKHTLVQRV